MVLRLRIASRDLPELWIKIWEKGQELDGAREEKGNMKQLRKCWLWVGFGFPVSQNKYVNEILKDDRMNI